MKQLVDIEQAYINTNHPDFISGSKAVSATLFEKDKRRPGSPGRESPKSAPKPVKKPSPVPKKPNPPAQQKSGYLGGWFGGNSPPRSVPDTSEPAREADEIKKDTSDEDTYDRQGRQFGGDRQLPKHLQVQAASDREKVETRIIKMLIQSYYNIVRKNIQDTVPKAIMHLLVNKSKGQVQDKLVAALYKDSQYDELLEENKEIAEKRREAKEFLERLKRAVTILNEVRHLSPEKLTS